MRASCLPGKGETPLNEECFLPYAYAPGVPFPKEKERLIFLLPPLYYTPEKKTTEKVTQSDLNIQIIAYLAILLFVIS